MNPAQWTAVDAFIDGHLVPADPVLGAVLAASAAAGLPPIQVSASQGKLLHLMARMQRASAILEVGTLGGYSTIWMARALEPGGRLTTIEIDPACTEVARANFERAGLLGRIDLREGPAIEILPTLTGPYDLVFIDANKDQNPEYFDLAVQRSRPGAVIIVDNVVRAGAVLSAESQDAAVQGVRRLFEAMAGDRRVTATAIQTVGNKGYDGFAVAVVVSGG